ncbi:hypothetical protein [Nesterenkonia pannonica]|uniref:hypothetical protein n=1 Tax=Nesterenkonia pannonica TaxID=1548602 RepID=UPI002164E097|nr:hypothetical protein [Nesterenkonia pannonica]
MVCAAAPVLLILTVVVCFAAGLMRSRGARTAWLLPLPALALFGPMLVSALDRGSNLAAVLLAEPGRTVSPDAAGESAPLWQQLLGHSQAFDPAAGLPGAAPG